MGMDLSHASSGELLEELARREGVCIYALNSDDFGELTFNRASIYGLYSEPLSVRISVPAQVVVLKTEG